MKYSWLVFDADNTLLDFNRSAGIALTETLQSMDIIPEKAIVDLYHKINLECWGDLEAGRITPAELKLLRFSRFLDQLGAAGDPEQLNAYYFDVLRRSTYLLDGARDVLEKLGHLGVPMAIATNGLAEVQHHRLAKAGIVPFFQEIIVSEEIGYFKPNPGFFHTTAERLQVDEKDPVLMIGDSLRSDIAGAQHMGWDTCWFNPNKEDQSLPVAPDFTIGQLDELLEILS